MKKQLKRVLAGVLTAALAISITAMPQNKIQAAAAGMGTGIDVSYHNGVVNWQAVKASGISFAFVRVASTKSGIDAQFVNNIVGANAAGLRVGVYIYSYATSVQGVLNEANLVLNAISSYPVSFPVVIDIEDASQRGLSPQQLADMANAFCTTVAAAGYYPMVYSSRNWFVSRIGAIPWDKWVAQYNSVNTYPGAYGVWQQSSHGSVPGVNGRVDVDFLFKDYASLIPAQGFASQGGITNYYTNYRKTAGWINDNGSRYFAGPDFAIRSGWFNDASGNYYLDPAQGGRAAIGWYPVGNNYYFFNAAGAMQVGLQNIGTQVVYLNDQGVAQKGMVQLPDGMHYFDENYAMRVGLTDIAGVPYYFNENGVLQTGLIALPQGLYFFGANGAAVKGWQDIAGARYYFADNYTALTGLQTLGDGVYLFGADGKMVTGTYKDPSGTYYFGADGKRVTGLAAVAGSNYYFGPDGKMQVGLVSLPQGTMYFGPDGKQVVGWAAINGAWYYFDPTSGMMLANTVVNVGGVPLQFDQTGRMVTPGVDPAQLVAAAG